MMLLSLIASFVDACTSVEEVDLLDDEVISFTPLGEKNWINSKDPMKGFIQFMQGEIMNLSPSIDTTTCTTVPGTWYHHNNTRMNLVLFLSSGAVAVEKMSGDWSGLEL